MNGWEGDKRWSDVYLPTVKEILGRLLIGAAPVEEDQERNTDLIVLRMEAVRIACRIRRYEQFLSPYGYRYQFTIRTVRPSGAKTEIAKIIAGWGDFMFYAFAAQDGPFLQQWTLLDLKEFRSWFNHHMATHAGKYPGIAKRNTDGSSEFLAFDLRKTPTALIRERSWEEAEVRA